MFADRQTRSVFQPHYFAAEITYIKIYADKNRSKGDFWLTGSQAFKLMQGMQESLAGRVAVLSLTSLSQAEMYGNNLEPFILDMEKLSARSRERKPANVREIFDRIYKGSMPAVISGQNKNTHIFYSSYVTTYIERDVRALSDSIDSLKHISITVKLPLCITIGTKTRKKSISY